MLHIESKTGDSIATLPIHFVLSKHLPQRRNNETPGSLKL